MFFNLSKNTAWFFFYTVRKKVKKIYLPTSKCQKKPLFQCASLEKKKPGHFGSSLQITSAPPGGSYGNGGNGGSGLQLGDAPTLDEMMEMVERVESS